jgi:hypothetical protein
MATDSSSTSEIFAITGSNSRQLYVTIWHILKPLSCDQKNLFIQGYFAVRVIPKTYKKCYSQMAEHPVCSQNGELLLRTYAMYYPSNVLLHTVWYAQTID